MLKIQRPLGVITALLVSTFMIFSYQNCAKKLDEVGVNSSLSLSAGSCTISAVYESVPLGTKQTINFSYSPKNNTLRVVLLNNTNGIFTENVYAQNGAVDVIYTNTNQVGPYTAYGLVEDSAGNTVADCQVYYEVTSSSGSTNTPPPSSPPPPTLPDEPPPSTATYSWATGSYGSCSATACGTTGTQSRSVTCKRNDGVTVSDSYCSGTKPATSRSCSAPACSYSYSWLTGSWGACSATACGTTGTQSRSVTCKRNDNTTVSDSYCSGTKPSSSQSCSAAPCGGGGGGDGGGSCKPGLRGKIKACDPF